MEYIRVRCRVCEDGCWEWGGWSRKRDARPTVAFRRPCEDGVVRAVSWPVRVLVYLLKTGKHLNGLKWTAEASCKNGLCVAPDHVKPVRRGTYNRGVRKPASQGLRISRTKAATSKVPDAVVAQFREHGADVPALSAEHGITASYGYQLRAGAWRKTATPSPFVGVKL